jgi:hypothetical protein
MKSSLAIGSVGGLLLMMSAACEEARAQNVASTDEATDTASSRAKRRAAYHAALAEHDAITPDSAARAQAAIDAHRPACVADELEWQRFVDVSFCTTPCAVDDDCLPEDRCTVLELGVAADGVTPQFEVALQDGTLAAGLCDPFWEEVAQEAADAAVMDE